MNSECERLQGYPDNWTLIGEPEEVEVKDYITEWTPGKNCKYSSVDECYDELFASDELVDADDLDDDSYEDMGGQGFDPKDYGFVKKRIQIGSHTEIQYIYTDRNGKRKRCADSARYKALGNSIALPFWEWLARRIAAEYERPVTMGSLFDGIGGFPLSFMKAGGEALWASEIEDFCIEVTMRRFPA